MDVPIGTFIFKLLNYNNVVIYLQHNIINTYIMLCTFEQLQYKQ